MMALTQHTSQYALKFAETEEKFDQIFGVAARARRITRRAGLRAGTIQTPCRHAFMGA